MSDRLKVLITIDDFGVPGNRFHCAIANALALADTDVLRPKVDENTIRYSRRSTGMTYIYVTPQRAADFIREFDRKVKHPKAQVRVEALKPFYLNLTEKNLMEVRPVSPPRQRQSDIKREMKRALDRAPAAVKAARPVATASKAEATTRIAPSAPKKRAPSSTPRQSPAWRV